MYAICLARRGVSGADSVRPTDDHDPLDLDLDGLSERCLMTCRTSGVEPVPRERAEGLIAELNEVLSSREPDNAPAQRSDAPESTSNSVSARERPQSPRNTRPTNPHPSCPSTTLCAFRRSQRRESRCGSNCPRTIVGYRK